MIITVPALDKAPWPTLGPQVCEWIEQNLCFGPGDLLGEPARIDDETRGLIYRMYEVYPRKHERAGRRRFNRCCVSIRKGSAKTEKAAWIAIAELHPEAPVRCKGWARFGEPVGRGVVDPYIPLMAYTEEQSDELAYSAVRKIIERSDIADAFDVGLERVMRIGGDGKLEAVASAPDARDGARTTHQIFDETHRLKSPRQRAAHQTMLANLQKRFIADPWSLEITTAPAPGENSVAESTMDYAKAIAEGRASDVKMFFFHRQADDGHNLTDREDVKAAVLEASGPLASWSNIDGIVEQWFDPTLDRAYLERVWLNRPSQSADKAFDIVRWRSLGVAGKRVPRGALIALGFDGARYRDSVGLVGTDLETGFQWCLGLWERPFDVEEWEAPEGDVNEAVAAAFTEWRVARFYCDPPYWESSVALWAQLYGKEVAVAWPTYRGRKMAVAVRTFANAVTDGSLTHDGGEEYSRHIANAFKKTEPFRDDEDKPFWTLRKERPDSPNKIDLCMAGILSWEARRDAMTSGAGRKTSSVYDKRGVRELPTLFGG